MKKMILGCCLALVLSDGECWGMKYIESLGEDTKTSTSMPKIEEATRKWTHLVSDGDVKSEIDVLIPQILGSRQKMEELVALICNPSNDGKFANYAHMVFTTAFPDCNNEERNKLGGMLAAISSDKCGGGGANPSTYWSDYDSGCFSAFTMDDALDSESWK